MKITFIRANNGSLYIFVSHKKKIISLNKYNDAIYHRTWVKMFNGSNYCTINWNHQNQIFKFKLLVYFFYNKKYIITKIFLLCTWCDIRSIHIFCKKIYKEKKNWTEFKKRVVKFNIFNII